MLYFRLQNEDKFCSFPRLDLRDDDEDMKKTKFASTDNTLDHNNRPTHILSEKVCLHIFSEFFSHAGEEEIYLAPFLVVAANGQIAKLTQESLNCLPDVGRPGRAEVP